MVKKRERSRNFTEMEKELLVDTLSNFSSIVENKKTDAKSIKIKEDAWDEITIIWNSNSVEGERTKDQLKVLYNGLKKKARKLLAKQKKDAGSNPGSLVRVYHIPELERRVLAFMNNESIAEQDVKHCDSIDEFDDFEYDLSQSSVLISPASASRTPFNSSPITEVSATPVQSVPKESCQRRDDPLNASQKDNMEDRKRFRQFKRRLKRDILATKKEKETIEKDILIIKKHQEAEQLNILKLKTKKEAVELALLELELRKRKN